LKIGIVCYPTLGGSGVVATELGHVLASRGHQVHFITYELPFRLRVDEKNIFFHQVEINRYDLFKYPDYALPLAVKIASVSKEYDLDVVHVHYAIPHATSAYLAKQILGKHLPKVITTLHGTDITLVGRDPAYYEVVKYSIEHSDAVTCVSESLRQQTMEWFSIEKPIEVIHNFFIPRRACIGVKPLRGRFVKQGEKLLIHSSNFRSVKRPEDVILIFQQVHRKIPSKLLLLGNGAGIETIRQMVKEKGLEDDVYFLGSNNNIDQYVSSADLLLLPSSQESFGLAALEAMAYGVPVVASNVGGLPELIVHGESGFLAPVGHVETMGDMAIELLSNSELYQKISEQCQTRAREKFSVSKIYPRYLELYQNVVSL
jgi:L-malate glycosyltransferase